MDSIDLVTQIKQLSDPIYIQLLSLIHLQMVAWPTEIYILSKSIVLFVINLFWVENVFRLEECKYILQGSESLRKVTLRDKPIKT
jgi:hypothetical protein